MTNRLYPALLVLAAAASTALAQSTPPGAADVLRSTQQPPAPPPSRGDSAISDVRVDERPALSLEGDIKVRVTAFKFSGNSAIDSATLSTVVAGDLNKELDAAGLVAAVKKVRRAYTSKGYFLAVAYLPKQEIKDGVVEIAVLEGRLGEIKVKIAPGTRFSEEQARKILDAHLKSGDLITESTLERPLLLIRDLPGLNAHSFIDPGKVIGTADLTVEVTGDQSGKMVDGNVDFDNYGNRFAGEHRVGGQVNVNSPLGRGDRLSVRAQVAQETATNLGSLNYSLPIGPYGTKLIGSYAELKYKLGHNLEYSQADAHGKATVVSLNAIHPIVRRRDGNLLVRVGVERTTTYDYLNITPKPDHKRITSSVIELSGDLFDNYKGSTVGSVGFFSGKTELLNPDRLAFDQTPGGGQTNGNFSKTVWSVSRFQQLPSDFFLDVSASGQDTSGKNLTSVEKFSLGGPTGVRAYSIGDAAGDLGQLYSVELRHALPKIAFMGNKVVGSLFYDWGEVKQDSSPNKFNPVKDPNTLKRAGYGFGVSAGSRESILLRLSVAWPDSSVKAVDLSDNAKREPRAYFQALKSF